MRLELKEYQHHTLETFDRWLGALKEARSEYERKSSALEEAGLEVSQEDRNFPRTAWKRLVAQGEIKSGATTHVDRDDAAGRPIPHCCFKVPTGGGKTLLGAAALERLSIQTGLVLWIVPTKAIYAQTKAAFRSREHPYRQILERASSGRVKLMEKDDRVNRDDIENYLCVMLLMLPATNRQKGKEFLKMFRDSGRYLTVFPKEDNGPAIKMLLADNPDLECHEDGTVKQSLFNVFKTLRPVVVLDEAHKAYGGKGATEFVRAVNRLNPRLVVELTATPNRDISNLLVDISGVDLKKEQMIKLPVEVTASGGEWRDTLSRAADRLNELQETANTLEGNSGRYIRPIAVVRVERTGKAQVGGDHIHAEDVRNHLVNHLGESPEAVRVKSSEQDEIAGHDLTSPYSPVRWIITKAALMEGWDCPFAYVLVMLDNTSSKRAITQLMGRVMRQPHARWTGEPELDKCYVHCWKTKVDDAVMQVKGGLEHEGLTGLAQDVVRGGPQATEMTTSRRRKRFRGRDIFLPKVLHRDGGGWRELSYQRHILAHVEWSEIKAPPAVATGSGEGLVEETVVVDLGGGPGSQSTRRLLDTDPEITLSWMTRQTTDLIPNPWQAARVARELLESLRERGLSEAEIYSQRRDQVVRLRARVAEQVERQAEQIFTDKLREGEIRFDLEASEPNFKMPEEFTMAVTVNDHSLERLGKPVQTSLFEPVFENQFDSTMEKDFAFYIDQHKAIQWWHRIAVRQQHEYYLRGWSQDRIWPDFVAMSHDGAGKQQLLVVETKGKHLEGNADTEYKTKVFATLENSLNADSGFECGEVSLDNGRTRGHFKIVFRAEDFAEVVGL